MYSILYILYSICYNGCAGGFGNFFDGRYLVLLNTVLDWEKL
jgi:hypothetical protein